ncbi:MAG: ABC transporter substrate-binding protein [Chloroflexota bacterium]
MPPGAPDGTSVRIGLVTSIDTGTGSGRSELRAAQLAVDTINTQGGLRLSTGTRPIELVPYDDEANAARAERIAARLSQVDRVSAVVGPSSAETAAAITSQLERLRTPVVTLASAGRLASMVDVGRWVFTLPLDGDAAIEHLVEFLSASRVERVGWIAPRTAAAERARMTLLRAAATRKIAVIAEETYSFANPDTSEAFARLSHAGATEIVAWPRDQSDAAILIRAASERAPRSRLYLGPSVSDDRLLASVTTPAPSVRAMGVRVQIPDELWDTDPLTPMVRQFVREFRGRYGYHPPPTAAVAWDAVRLVAQAAQSTDASPTAVRDRLELTQRFAGASGSVSYSPTGHDGLDKSAFLIMRMEAGNWRSLP